MERLGGHPLSLNLVLPQLKGRTPEELTARFEELLPGFTAGAAKERNESLEVSLRFSLERLGEATRAALPDLAVFQGGALEAMLLEITAIDPGLWQAARAELQAAALVSAETLPGVNPPFLRFHPTLLPYLGRQLGTERRAELEARYWQRYYALASYLYKADSRTPHQARVIALRELPNLRRAFDLALQAGAGNEAVELCRQARRVSGHLRPPARAGRAARPDRRAKFETEGGPNPRRLPAAATASACAAGRGPRRRAERAFRELLARLEAGAAYDTAYDRPLTLEWIGKSLEEHGRLGRR